MTAKEVEKIFKSYKHLCKLELTPAGLALVNKATGIYHTWPNGSTFVILNQKELKLLNLKS